MPEPQIMHPGCFHQSPDMKCLVSREGPALEHRAVPSGSDPVLTLSFLHVSLYRVFGLVWFGLVWFGLVWFGLVWFGLVWFGLVWLAASMP